MLWKGNSRGEWPKFGPSVRRSARDEKHHPTPVSSVQRQCFHTAINHKADFISAEVLSKGFGWKHSGAKSDK